MKMIQTLSSFFSLILMASMVHGQGAVGQDGGEGHRIAVQDLEETTEGVELEGEPLEFDSELPLPGDSDPDLTDAIELGRSWIELIDRMSLDEAWNRANDFFRGQLSESEWKEEVQASREPLGTLEERELESTSYYSELPPIVPEGEYVKLTFFSRFSGLEEEIREKVTLLRAAGEDWIVSGYRIPE